MKTLHVILATLGTDGDVFPFIGLGAALRSRGHRVTLATQEPYRELAAEHGFEFRALATAAETAELFENPDVWHPVKAGVVLARWGAGKIEPQYRELAGLAARDGALLAANPGVLAARLVQERFSVPMASIILQPWMIPSSIAPPVMMPAGLSLPAWAPRPCAWLYWRLLDAAGHLLIGRQLNRLRAAIDLKPVRRLFRWWLSPDLALGLFPPWFGAPQSDWPPQLALADFPLYDGRSDRRLPADLAAFLEAGDAPVAFTFGSGMQHGAHLFQAAAEACRILGRRGIFLTRHRAQLPEPLPEAIIQCDYAPFQELFPRCAAVVHHGGVGTTAKALAVAAPQLILPIAYDQLDNARRVKKLGAGDWLKSGAAAGPRLAAALSSVLAPGALERCLELRGLCGHQGLEAAARRLEDFAGG